MKFIYGYKTKENVEREGVISASSRDAVYRELKAQGIRPFKVVLAPGFGNWLASLGKRTYAIVLLCALCLVLCAVVLRTKHDAQSTMHSPQPRHQIYGDPALMEELERTGYSTVFSHEGDRVLARYAQPGDLEKSRSAKDEMRIDADALAASISIPDEEAIAFTGDDVREVVELKRIVLWMRGELRAYLANGIGTPERYVRRLIERQKREAQVYYTAQNDLKDEKRPERWERVNEALRAMGLKTIPAPAEAAPQGPNMPVTQTGEKK